MKISKSQLNNRLVCEDSNNIIFNNKYAMSTNKFALLAISYPENVEQVYNGIFTINEINAKHLVKNFFSGTEVKNDEELYALVDTTDFTKVKLSIVNNNITKLFEMTNEADQDMSNKMIGLIKRFLNDNVLAQKRFDINKLFDVVKNVKEVIKNEGKDSKITLSLTDDGLCIYSENEFVVSILSAIKGDSDHE